MGRWSDARLDELRLVGDEPADAVVTALFADGGVEAVNALLGRLTRDDELVPAALPAIVRDYLTATAVPALDAAAAEAGERVFAEHGPEILLMLACYSLPAAYAAKKGVEVLYRTGYLARRPNRRLFETTQMVIDVMTPGGLEAQGRGSRTVQKVRLMHAAIRHLVQADTAAPWDAAAMGVPINQEDLAGTLMTFSWLVIDGLRRLGVELGDAAATAYLEAWRVVGGHMGVQPELVPADLAEAKTLTETIQRRQIAPSESGRALTTALLEMLEGNLPGPARDVPAAAMRLCLPPAVADGLGVPRHDLETKLFHAAAELLGAAERDLRATEGRRRALRAVNLALADAIAAQRTTEVGRELRIPTDLRASWALPAEREPGGCIGWLLPWLGKKR
jgi:uncharacterized protein (DUF2236 family)